MWFYRNPDEDLRVLIRLIAQGDKLALAKFTAAAQRGGVPDTLLWDAWKATIIYAKKLPNFGGSSKDQSLEAIQWGDARYKLQTIVAEHRRPNPEKRPFVGWFDPKYSRCFVCQRQYSGQTEEGRAKEFQICPECQKKHGFTSQTTYGIIRSARGRSPTPFSIAKEMKEEFKEREAERRSHMEDKFVLSASRLTDYGIKEGKYLHPVLCISCNKVEATNLFGVCENCLKDFKKAIKQEAERRYGELS